MFCNTEQAHIFQGKTDQLSKDIKRFEVVRIWTQEVKKERETDRHILDSSGVFMPSFTVNKMEVFLNIL